MIIDLEQDHLESVIQILEPAGLPSSDIRQVSWHSFLGWRDGLTIVGIAGAERCGDCILLRSVAIEKSHRGLGLASRLVVEIHDRASMDGFEKCYLLTLDADGYFSRNFNYTTIDRRDAPAAIQKTSQFSGVCPASAVLMEKPLVSL